MKDDPTPPHDDAQLHAWVDGRLDAAARGALRERLDADPQAAATADAWAAQKDALRALHGQLLREPPPASLLAAARRLDARSTRLARWQRWGGLAASLLVAFGVGWGGHGEWSAHRDRAGLGAAQGQAFARQALVAHAVYAPEMRHPVEVDAAQQQHLVQWLSKRLDRPLKIPRLAEHGYELVGGRLLPGDAGARAQFMYQAAGGERITLYVGALRGAAAGETAFRFTGEGPAASFYWVDDGFGYALAGQLPRQRLLVLAQAVHRQL